jgi:hypothetical protein
MATTTVATSLSYILLLVGGVNWLTTGLRLAVDNAGDDKYGTVPDLLSWGGESFQIVIYLAVGASAAVLLVSAFVGYWVRGGGDPLITCII